MSLANYASTYATLAQLERFVHIYDLLYSTVALDFDMQAQTQSNWCWAATSTSVSLFYRPTSTWTQCKVASAELNLTTCCDSPVPGACNVPWYLDRALTRTRNFVSISGPISFDAVKAELQAGRVVGARTGWSGGGGHFMVIYGASTAAGEQYFDIDDPIYGKSHVTVSTFSTAYQGSGTWTHAYLTKAAPNMFDFKAVVLSEAVLRLISIQQRLRELHGVHDDEVAPGLVLPHPIYAVGLKDLAKGKPALDAPSALRVIELRGSRPSGYYDISDEGSAPRMLEMGGADSPYLASFERSVETAARSVKAREGDVELRLIRIPALYTDALWLHEADNDVAVVLNTQQELPVNQPMPLDRLFKQLKDIAAKALADDDGLKGA